MINLLIDWLSLRAQVIVLVDWLVYCWIN